MNDFIRAESVLINIFSLEKVNFARLEQLIEALLYNVHVLCQYTQFSLNLNKL